MAAADLVDEHLRELAGDSRRLAHAEWGLTVPAHAAGGAPLEVGLRIADGLLRATAPAVGGDAGVDPWMLLWWNRQTRLVRFACARNGDIWVHGDVPVKGLDEKALDRLLGLVAEGALAMRTYAAGLRPDPGAADGGSWLRPRA